METKNILEEVSELLKSTNESLKFVVSRKSTDYVGLLVAIQTTLTNLEKVLKCEGYKLNLEQAKKYQAYFFISEIGYLSKFKEYCEKNPLEEFK